MRKGSDCKCIRPSVTPSLLQYAARVKFTSVTAQGRESYGHANMHVHGVRRVGAVRSSPKRPANSAAPPLPTVNVQ